MVYSLHFVVGWWRHFFYVFMAQYYEKLFESKEFGLVNEEEVREEDLLGLIIKVILRF